MTTVTPTDVCALPLSPEEAGLSREGGSGNAVLLLASELPPAVSFRYQQAGCVLEGASIDSCQEEVYRILEHLQLRYCAWPDRHMTLIVLDHALLSMVEDALVVSWLRTAETPEEPPLSTHKEG